MRLTRLAPLPTLRRSNPSPPALKPVRRGAIGRALTLLDLHGAERAVEQIDQEERARDQRRLDRLPKGAHGHGNGTPQCYGCRRILPRYGADCPNCAGRAQGTRPGR